MGKDGENNKFWNGSGRGLLNKVQFKKGKAIRISKQYNKSEHKKNKDNEKKDFINGNWKKCSYKRNNRIKNSIGESVGFLKYVTG